VISAYRAILELKPDDPIAPNNLALVLNQRRRWNEAEPIAQRAVNGGMTGNIFGQLIQAQLAQGKTAEARATLAEFAKRDSGSIFLHRLRSGAYASAHALDSARMEVDRVSQTSRDPSDQSWVNVVRSAISLTRGQLGETEQQLHDYMAVGERRGLPQDYLTGAAALARIQAVLRRSPAEAVRILDAALARHPLSTMPTLDRPYANLITAYAIAGQPARARQLLNEYRAMVPENIRRSEIDSHEAAGYVALAENHPADAITEFRQQWDESGCTGCALADMGRAFDLLKQPDSAVAVYQRNAESAGGLLRIFNDQWDLAHSYRRLGELYEDKGNREKALDYYGRFVQLWKEADPELQPQVKDVKERMARLAGEKK